MGEQGNLTELPSNRGSRQDKGEGGTSGRGSLVGGGSAEGGAENSDWSHQRGCSCCQRCCPEGGRRRGNTLNLPLSFFCFSTSASHRLTFLEARVQVSLERSFLGHWANQGGGGQLIWWQTGHKLLKIIAPRSWWASSIKPLRNSWVLCYRNINYSGT